MNIGKMAGKYKDILMPVGYTALSYGLGKLSGQSDTQALANAVTGVAGSYLGENLASKLGGKTFVVRIGEKDIPIKPVNIGGSILGGQLGAGVGNTIHHFVNPSGHNEMEMPGFLNAIDELAVPAKNVVTGLF